MVDNNRRQRWMFCVASAAQYGGGHVMRSLQLAKAMRCFVDVCFLIDSPQSHWVSVLQSYGFDVLNDVSDLTGVVDGLWVDHYEPNIAAFRALSIPIAGIVDIAGHHARYDFSVSYVACESCDISGFEYALIDPAYAALKRAMDGRMRYSLCFGQTDSKQVTLSVLKVLESYPNQLDLNVVCGKTNVNRNSLLSFIESSRHRISLIDSPDSLQQVFEETDVFITSGGVAVLEACAAAIPCVVLTTAQNQVGQVGQLAEMGAVLRCDTVDDVVGSINYLSDENHYNQISACSKTVVDGKGSKRLCDDLLRWRRNFHD